MSDMARALGIDVAEVEAKMAAGHSLPTRCYWDPAIYRFELDTLFSCSWQYVAPRAKLSRPGDCMSAQIANVPLVLTCAEDGELRGFVNVCRHRGFRVMREDGHRRHLVCGYHGWTYGLDGRLERTPGCESEPGLDKCELGLVPVAVDTWGPMVFANLDAHAPALRAAHPSFVPTARSRGFDADPRAYRHHRRILTEVSANWKLWYDNHVECYHCPVIHSRSFAEAYDVAPERVESAELERMTTYRFLPRESEDTDTGRLRSRRYRSMQLFPGSLIVQQDDIMVLSQMIPTGAQSTRYVADYFAEPQADPTRVEQWVSLWDQTFREDADAVAIQQEGLAAGRVPYSRFMSERERPLVFINKLVWEAYKQGLELGGPASRVA